MQKRCVYVYFTFYQDHLHRFRDRKIVIRPIYDVSIILVGDKNLMRTKVCNITALA
jgi:hypothetical protein